MHDEVELLFRNLSNTSSIAVDLHAWTLLLGLSRSRRVVSSQGKIWAEWSLWLGPLNVTLTLYGDRQ